MASQDHRFIKLLHSVDGRFVLLHDITWEAVELDDMRSPWQITYDDDAQSAEVQDKDGNV